MNTWYTWIFTMRKKFLFGKNGFKGSCFTSKFQDCILQYLSFRTRLHTQNSFVGVIFDAKHNDQDIFPIFEILPTMISELGPYPAKMYKLVMRSSCPTVGRGRISDPTRTVQGTKSLPNF